VSNQATERQQKTIAELLNLLDIVFTLYEDGIDCYDSPEENGEYIGKAILIDGETFLRIADILESKNSTVQQQNSPDSPNDKQTLSSGINQ
jgi:hypothetical protein